MKNINWKVRMKKRSFWLALTAALLVLAQQALSWVGVDIAVEIIQHELTQFINTIFMILAILGIVVDPTTTGVKDSERALNYKEPNGGE